MIFFVSLMSGICFAQPQQPTRGDQVAGRNAQACGAFSGTPKIKVPDKITTKKLNRFPVVAYSFAEDGKPFNIKVTKSTGSRELDDLLVRQVKEWRLVSFPGCGVIDSSIKLVIDVR